MTDTVSLVFLLRFKASHNVITSTTTASAMTQGTSAVVALDSGDYSGQLTTRDIWCSHEPITYAVDNLSNVKVNSEAARGAASWTRTTRQKPRS